MFRLVELGFRSRISYSFSLFFVVKVIFSCVVFIWCIVKGIVSFVVFGAREDVLLFDEVFVECVFVFLFRLVVFGIFICREVLVLGRGFDCMVVVW